MGGDFFGEKLEVEVISVVISWQFNPGKVKSGVYIYERWLVIEDNVDRGHCQRETGRGHCQWDTGREREP